MIVCLRDVANTSSGNLPRTTSPSSNAIAPRLVSASDQYQRNRGHVWNRLSRLLICYCKQVVSLPCKHR